MNNGRTNHNIDCCVNIVDEIIPMAKNLVKFDPVTPKILWLICMGGECRETNIHTVLVEGHPVVGSSIASL